MIRSLRLLGFAVLAFATGASAQTVEVPSNPGTAMQSAQEALPVAGPAEGASPEPAEAAGPAAASEDTSAPDPAKDAGDSPSPLETHRLSFEELNERVIGSASQAVRFNWRRTTVGLGVLGSSLLELNNFGSNRLGIVARRPVFGGMLGEVAISRVSTWSTPSSNLLALTPYRQAGRPSRWELDVNLSFPLAEGVVTAWPSFFPATQLVLSATAGARYLFYPGSVWGLPLLDASTALISPYLRPEELENLESQRNGGMVIDSARFGLLAGLSVDLYFHQGFFFTPRALLALPVLNGLGATGVGFWWELTFAAGWAF